LLGKPFALLLPLNALESERRQMLFRNGLEVITFPRRLRFTSPSGKNEKSPRQAVAWFTHGLKIRERQHLLPEDFELLVFEKERYMLDPKIKTDHLNGAEAPQVITGVRCSGCRKYKPIATHHNLKKQALCSRCNGFLIKRFGSKYGQVLADPAATIQALEEHKEEKKDLKAVRRTFTNILNEMEEYDLPQSKRRLIFEGFADVFIGLPEAESFLNFNKDVAERESEKPTDDIIDDDEDKRQ
jgi:hypothetical protein